MLHQNARTARLEWQRASLRETGERRGSSARQHDADRPRADNEHARRARTTSATNRTTARGSAADAAQQCYTFARAARRAARRIEQRSAELQLLARDGRAAQQPDAAHAAML